MKRFLNFTEALLAFLWLRIGRSASNDGKSLAVIRILSSLFLIAFGTPSFSWIHTVPPTFFNPPGRLSLSYYFSGFPLPPLFWIIDCVLLTIVFGLLFGIRARLCGLLYFIMLIFGNSFRFSFGKIDHDIMFPIFILGLSFTNWGTYLALVPDKKVPQKLQTTVLAVLGVTLSFGMFTAGFEKALSWIDFDLATGGFLAWFYDGFFNAGRTYLLAPQVLYVPPRFFEAFDYFSVIFELTPLLALLAGKRWWHLWLLTACIFHLGTTLLLNISFTSQVPVYLSFFPLRHSFLRRVPETANPRWIPLVAISAVSATLLHYVIQIRTNGFIMFNSLISYLLYLLPISLGRNEIHVSLAMIIWILTIVLILQVKLAPINNRITNLPLGS